MSTDNSGLKTILSSALVAAAVTAGGIGLFLTNYPAATVPQSQLQAETSPSASPAAQSSLSELQKDEIKKLQTTLIDQNKEKFEALIRNYLMQNPQILMEVSDELDRRQNEERQQARSTAVSKNADAIFRGKNQLIAGNPNGNVTIVEFSDYNCPYCKRAFKHLDKLIKTDSNVKVILKEFPIFGEESEGAARVAIAANKQGRYFDVHTSLLHAQGRANEQSALRIAEKLGLDMDKLRTDMQSEEVRNTISETARIARNLGIQGTPFFLVGDRTIPGAPDDLYDVFTRNVADVRKNGCEAKC